VFFPTSTATTIAATTGAPLIDITTSGGCQEDRRVNARSSKDQMDPF
jgi:acetyl-CoA carboxylase carboxyltransferase component